MHPLLRYALSLALVGLLAGCNISQGPAARVIGAPPNSLGPAPTVASINPTSWGVKGSTTATITGEFFEDSSSVSIGGDPCTSVNVVSSTELTCTLPYHPAEVVDVVVSNPDGQTGTLIDGFKYNSFLFVTTQGGASIFSYVIDSGDASVTAVGSYAGSNGMYQMAVDPTNTFLYSAATSGNIVGYTINSQTGALTAIAGSPWAGSNTPNGVAITPDGTKLYVSNWTGANVSAFTVDTGTGALTSVGNFAAGTNPGAMTIDSTGSYLYVSNYGSNTISGFDINADGTLSALAGSPYGGAGVSGPDGIEIHPNGQFLYAGNAKSPPNVSAWNVATDGTLTLQGTYSIVDDTTGGSGVALDASGSYLYATAMAAGTVRGYSVQPDGSLVALAPTNQFNAQTGTNYVVIQRLGRIVATANTASNSLTVFDRNTQDGSLSLNQNFGIGATPGTVFMTN